MKPEQAKMFFASQNQNNVMNPNKQDLQMNQDAGFHQNQNINSNSEQNRIIGNDSNFNPKSFERFQNFAGRLFFYLGKSSNEPNLNNTDLDKKGKLNINHQMYDAHQKNSKM